MESKDVIITIIGIIGSIITAILFDYIIKLNIINLIFTFIGLLTVLILIITYYLSKRIKESEERLDDQETEQKRLGEKLKIHEQLIDIKKNIEFLKQELKEKQKR